MWPPNPSWVPNFHQKSFQLQRMNPHVKILIQDSTLFILQKHPRITE
jgi:hypothetical protein